MVLVYQLNTSLRNVSRSQLVLMRFSFFSIFNFVGAEAIVECGLIGVLIKKLADDSTDDIKVIYCLPLKSIHDNCALFLAFMWKPC